MKNLLCKLTAEAIPVDVGDFRLMDRKVSNALKNMPEQEAIGINLKEDILDEISKHTQS